MMNRFSFPIPALWLVILLFSPLVVRADEQPAAPAAPAQPAVEPPPAPAVEPAAPPPAPEASAPAVVETPAPTADKTVEKDHEAAADEAEEPARKHKWDHHSVEKDWSYKAPRGSRVLVMQDNEVTASQKVKGDAIAVLGDIKVDGEVGRDAVAVAGDAQINGIVRRHAVAVLGDVHLGPKAHVYGDVVSVTGDVIKDPGAVVEGEIRREEGGREFEGLRAWWQNALRIGRPLAFAAHLSWLWIVTAFSVAFYALLGLLFPRAIRNCGDKLVLQPGLVILAALLAILALPVLFILLCITVVGIPVALLVLPVSLLLATLVGKAAIYGLVGRKISGERLPMALSVLIGAAIFIVLYLLPVLGVMLSLLVSLVGFGCVVLSIFGDRKPAVPPVPPVPGATVQSPVAAAPGAGPAVLVPPVVPVPATLPPVISSATLPRAGFWLRIAASGLDAILIGILCGLVSNVWHNFPDAYLLWYSLYCVVMWATKGTTIGGVICGLRVVRLDDRPLDWGISIVRVIGAWLSLAVVGIGFIWVAFDDDRQSWHDKIAGTTIVKVPRGTSLL